MDVSNRIVKTVLTLLFLLGTVFLGAIFGAGGIFVALLIGLTILAIVSRGKVRRASPPNGTETNPASGSFMMPGGLLDVRGSPYGARRDD